MHKSWKNYCWLCYSLVTPGKAWPTGCCNTAVPRVGTPLVCCLVRLFALWLLATWDAVVSASMFWFSTWLLSWRSSSCELTTGDGSLLLGMRLILCRHLLLPMFALLLWRLLPPAADGLFKATYMFLTPALHVTNYLSACCTFFPMLRAQSYVCNKYYNYYLHQTELDLQQWGLTLIC